MGKYYRWFSIIVCSGFLIAATIGLTIQCSEFSKDVSNGCFDRNVGEPIKSICVKEPTWYDTSYKKWEREANIYIENNLLYLFIS